MLSSIIWVELIVTLPNIIYRWVQLDYFFLLFMSINMRLINKMNSRLNFIFHVLIYICVHHTSTSHESHPFLTVHTLAFYHIIILDRTLY
jgi:hypothetical protein